MKLCNCDDVYDEDCEDEACKDERRKTRTAVFDYMICRGIEAREGWIEGE